MPALAAISLDNSVPAAVVFNPVGKNGTTSVLQTNNSVYDAKSELQISLNRITKTSSVNRIKARITVPKMDSVDTAKKVAFLQADVTLLLPKEATSVDRADLLAFIASLAANASFKTMVTNVEDLY